MEKAKQIFIIAGLLFIGYTVPLFAGNQVQTKQKAGWTERKAYGFTIQVQPDYPWNPTSENAYRFLKKALYDFYLTLAPNQATNLVQSSILLRHRPQKSSICYNPKQKSIVINNLPRFYRESCNQDGTPFITQFARKYYDCTLSPELKQETAKTFQKSKGLYKGKNAVKNPMSYFAKLTTIYYGITDTKPQDYHALMAFDAQGFSLMEKIWGKRNLKDYRRVFIEGFRVLYPIRYEKAPEVAAGIQALHEDLAKIAEIVPTKFVNLLRRRILWLDQTNNGAACYHPGIDWLLANGVIPEKCRCVEISNFKHYTQWRKQNQPFMILHEYAHLFHFSSYADRPDIPNAYQNAMFHHLYDNVPYLTGDHKLSKKKAYATTNPYEFFSETSEAYFGKNDFYPFNRKELKEHDPVTYALLEKIWNEDNFTE